MNFIKLLFEVFIAGILFIFLGVSFLIHHVKLGEKIGIILFLVIIIGGVLLVITIEATSTNGFCLTCHPYFEEEFYSTAHAEAGVTCADCHIPEDIKGFTKAKLGGLKEAWIYFTEDHPETRNEWYENYKIKWEELAYEHNLTEYVCLECHGEDEEYPYIDVMFEDMKIHETLKVEENELSCFDCHYNFVHGILEWEGNNE